MVRGVQKTENFYDSCVETPISLNYTVDDTKVATWLTYLSIVKNCYIYFLYFNTLFGRHSSLSGRQH